MVNREEGRKKERDEKERKREGMPYSADESHQVGWHDSFMRRVD
jgi:hypothetical protein